MDKQQAFGILMSDFMNGNNLQLSVELVIATHRGKTSKVASLWFSYCWSRYMKGDQSYYEILKCIQPDVIEGQVYPLVLSV